MQHSRKLDVVAVVTHAPYEARVFLAQHSPVADGLLVIVDEFGRTLLGCGHDPLAMLSADWWLAAQRMERTIVA